MLRYFLPLFLVLTGLSPGQDGAAIYAEHCASCHGKLGEGVPDEVDEPLRGDRSLPSLARYIDKWMPDDDPDELDAEQSRRVAEYIYDAFYSQGSAPRPEPAFARLTNRQFRESVADLLGSFGKMTPPGEGRGLKAHYFQSDGMNKKARQGLEREDAALAFDFGEAGPAEGISADQFSIAWDGSLLPQETGWHEFKIVTPNGARLYLNGEHQDGDGNYRDDSGAKRQPALIDAWVSSGSEVREVAARVFLLGGRAYPLRLDYFKYKEKFGSIRLEWKQPGGVWEVLAAPYLSPAGASHVAVVSTAFPPDDASEGYERGTDISKEWDEATTAAAVEIANQVVARLPQLSQTRDDAPDRAERLKQFVATLAERAFRRPLSGELRTLYVERAFTGGALPEQAVKRAVILILKSPRFLYPELLPEKDDFTVASRLALGMWDSLPDPELWKAAGEGKLHEPEQVKSQARRLAADPRAKAKLRGFFQRWLKLDAEGDLHKDPAKFPGFDAAIVADLRRSLELFVDRVVWSEKSAYRELIDADYLLFNERLAKFYDVPAPAGGGFQPVKLDADRRAGVLTHPYLLARLAHPDVTSPIHRGVFLVRNVLGGILKPPPQANLFDNHSFDPKLTTRQKVATLTSDTSCMTCHERINPLGFALESFDPVGRFRPDEDGKPIDTNSDFPTAGGGTIHLAGPRDVAAYALKSSTARRGFIRQLLQYSLKQNPAVYGPGTLQHLDKSFTAEDENIRDLLIEIDALGALRGITKPEQASR